jgi:hypothetical protein
MTIVRSCPAVSTSTPCCSTRPLCALHSAYIHEWSYDVILVRVNGDAGSDWRWDKTALRRGLLELNQLPFQIWVDLSLNLFPALVWSIYRPITSGSGLNANLGTIIWTDLFVFSFSTFKLADTHSSHIPSNKSLRIMFLLGAGYAILSIRSSLCYSPGICLLSLSVSEQSANKTLKKK